MQGIYFDFTQPRSSEVGYWSIVAARAEHVSLEMFMSEQSTLEVILHYEGRLCRAQADL